MNINENINTAKNIKFLHITYGITLVGLWLAIYLNLEKFANFITFNLMKLSPESHLGISVSFFLYDTPKILMLLVLIVFFIGIIRSYITTETTKKILAGKNEFAGNILAALLGVFTPFCSCSAVPLFVGFVTGGIPLGVTFSFLIAAPMVNEIALAMLFGLFGIKIAAIYLIAGLALAVVSGYIIKLLKMERYLQDWVLELKLDEKNLIEEKKQFYDRIKFALESVKDIVGKIWLYVIIGIGVGAIIHGYVPQGILSSVLGSNVWWAVPFAIVIGIPMYSNAAGIIPIVSALIEKGAAMGTVLAFMMSVIALSLPEILILRQVLKFRLIVIFVNTVAIGILFVGYLFNIII